MFSWLQKRGLYREMPVDYWNNEQTILNEVAHMLVSGVSIAFEVDAWAIHCEGQSLLSFTRVWVQIKTE